MNTRLIKGGANSTLQIVNDESSQFLKLPSKPCANNQAGQKKNLQIAIPTEDNKITEVFDDTEEGKRNEPLHLTLLKESSINVTNL